MIGNEREKRFKWTLGTSFLLAVFLLIVFIWAVIPALFLNGEWFFGPYEAD
jgi:hypothetical protein